MATSHNPPAMEKDQVNVAETSPASRKWSLKKKLAVAAIAAIIIIGLAVRATDSQADTESDGKTNDDDGRDSGDSELLLERPFARSG